MVLCQSVHFSIEMNFPHAQQMHHRRGVDEEVDEDDEVGNEVNEKVVVEGINLKLNNENMVILKKTF